MHYARANLSAFDTGDNYHYFYRGEIVVPPDELYSSMVSSIRKTDFLHIVEGNQFARTLRIKSDRGEDPRGMIDVSIYRAPCGAKFFIRIRDEEFLRVVNGDGYEARYGTGSKREDTLAGVLLKEATEDAKRRLAEEEWKLK